MGWALQQWVSHHSTWPRGVNAKGKNGGRDFQVQRDTECTEIYKQQREWLPASTTSQGSTVWSSPWIKASNPEGETFLPEQIWHFTCPCHTARPRGAAGRCRGHWSCSEAQDITGTMSPCDVVPGHAHVPCQLAYAHGMATHHHGAWLVPMLSRWGPIFPIFLPPWGVRGFPAGPYHPATAGATHTHGTLSSSHGHPESAGLFRHH